MNEQLEIVMTFDFISCLSREKSANIRKAGLKTYQKLKDTGVKGPNLQFEGCKGQDQICIQ